MPMVKTTVAMDKRTNFIIFSGFGAGSLIAIAVMFFRYSQERSHLLEYIQNDTLLYSLLGLSVFLIFLANFFYKRHIINARESNMIGEKLQYFRVASVIKWSVLEGAVILTSVSGSFGGDIRLLALSALLWILYLKEFPNYSKLPELLDMNSTMKMNFEDPNFTFEIEVQNPKK